jgi:hypothetical protein
MDLSFQNMIKPPQPEPSPAMDYIQQPKGLTPEEIAEAQMIYQGQQKAPQGQPPQPKPTKGWGSL